jgi:hypothetical protein
MKYLIPRIYKSVQILSIWLFIILFTWSSIDIFASMKGELPLRAQETLQTVYERGRGYAMLPQFQDYWNYVNSYGMRREEIPEPQIGEKHILTLGDSTCYASNSGMENQWASVLERDLRQKGVKVTIMNGGVPGYSLVNMMFALKWYKEKLPFQIDMLLIHGSWNNYWNDTPSDPNFDLEKAVKKYFPHFPESLEPNHNLVKYESYSEETSDIRTPRILKWISLNSILGNYLVKNLWFKFVIPVMNRTRVASQDLTSSQAENMTIDERYLVDLGVILHTAKMNGIKPIMLRQISVLRIPGFDVAGAVKEYPGYMAKDYTWMKPRMKRMDEIQDFYAKYGLAELVDPLPDVWKEINATNVFHKDSELSYMGSPSHTKDRGSIVLGKSISNQLLQKKLVTITEEKPWIHPKESNVGYDLNYREFNYNWTKRKTTVLFFLILLFEVTGGLALILFSAGKIVFPFPGFSFGVGFLLILFQFYFYKQFIASPLSAFVMSALLVPILIVSVIVLKKRFISGQFSIATISKRLSLNVIVLLAGLVLFNYITIAKNEPSKQLNYRAIQSNAAWMQFSEDNLAGKSRIYSVFTNIRIGDKPLVVLDILNYLPAFKSFLPDFALSVKEVFKIKSEDALLLFNGFPFIYLLSGVLFALRGKRAIIRKLILIIPFCVAVYYFGRFSFSPLMQVFSLGVFVFSLTSLYKKKLKQYNGGFILLSLSGGMLLILPEVWSVGVILSLCIYYGYLQSRNSIKFSYHLIKKTFLCYICSIVR